MDLVVTSGGQDTGTMTSAEPGKMFQWTLCARLLPDLVSSRSKYLMNLNKFSALENVSPLIWCSWWRLIHHTHHTIAHSLLLTDLATVTQQCYSVALKIVWLENK